MTNGFTKRFHSLSQESIFDVGLTVTLIVLCIIIVVVVWKKKKSSNEFILLRNIFFVI